MPLKTIYVSKAGSDGNDGLTPATAKLTLNGAKSILQTGVDGNKIWVGIGTYTETIPFGTPYTITDMWGDYDGVIFGTAPGVVERATNAVVDSNLKSMNNMTWTKLNSFSSMIECSGNKTTSVNDFTANNVIFNFAVNYVYLVPSNTYSFLCTLNNCSITSTFATNYFNAGATMTIVTVNNCDFDTGMTTGFTAGPYGRWTFTNGTTVKLVAGNTFFEHRSNLSLTDITWPSGAKCSGSASSFIQSAIIFLGKSIWTNITGANMNSILELFSVGTYWFPGNYNFMDSCGASAIYIAQDNSNANVYNVDSDALNHIVCPFNNLIITQHAAHNDDEVIHFRCLKTGSGLYRSPYLIPLNVNNGTPYTLTFDFLRNTTNAKDVTVSIIKGDVSIDATAFVTDTYTSGSHTNDTWYDGKTLNFTPDDDDQYFFMIDCPVNTGTNNHVKITVPVLTVT